jgi:hypothetical protein
VDRARGQAICVRCLLTVRSQLSQPEFELIRFAEIPPTVGFTHNAESENSRRSSFSASAATTCVDSLFAESSLFGGRESGPTPILPDLALELSRSLFNRRNGLTTRLRSDPDRIRSRTLA